MFHVGTMRSNHKTDVHHSDSVISVTLSRLVLSILCYSLRNFAACESDALLSNNFENNSILCQQKGCITLKWNVIASCSTQQLNSTNKNGRFRFTETGNVAREMYEMKFAFMRFFWMCHILTVPINSHFWLLAFDATVACCSFSTQKSLMKNGKIKIT